MTVTYNRNRQQAGNESSTLPIIEENLEVGKREVETGGIRIRSRIVEKAVEETINLREEHVRVERTSVDRPASEDDFTREGDRVVKVTDESDKRDNPKDI